MELQLPGEEAQEPALDRSFQEHGQYWTWVSVIVTLAVIFWTSRPQPYWPPIITAAGLPVLGLWIVARSRGVIALTSSRSNQRPNVAVAIFAPVVILMVRAHADWNVVDWKRALLPVASGAVPLLLLLFLLLRRLPGPRLGAGFILAGFGVAYCAALVVFLNCGLDRSAPYLRENAVVVEQRIARGKSTSYYLTLDRWNGAPELREIQVRSALYAAHPEHSAVELTYFPGALGVPWVRIR